MVDLGKLGLRVRRNDQNICANVGSTHETGARPRSARHTPNLLARTLPYGCWGSGSFIRYHLPDYKKTSLLQSVQVFEEFVTGLERTWKGKLIEESGEEMLIFQTSLGC